MRLLAVELDRFRSRRAIVLMLLGAVLLSAVLVGTALWDTRPVTDAERAEAQSQVATAEADPRLQREQAQCEEQPEDFFGPGATAEDCAGLSPRVEDFYPRTSLQLDRVVENRGTVQVVMVTALLVLCGATFAGGDWHTGSIANQLLFRPRIAWDRHRLGGPRDAWLCSSSTPPGPGVHGMCAHWAVRSYLRAQRRGTRP